MSLRLPLTGSKTRELFDVRHLAEVASPENRSKLMTRRECVSRVKDAMSANKSIRAIHSFCLSANGHLHLLRVGPRGGVSRIWDFGVL
jgi:hypothetical protein